MNSKVQALKAFSNQRPEQVPVCVFLGGVWPFTHAGKTLEELIGDPDTAAQSFYQVNEALDADIIMAGAGATALTIRALGGAVRFNGHEAPSIEGFLIEQAGDLERLSALKPFDDPALVWIRQTACRLFELAGAERLILASGRAPFTLAGQMYGIERLSKAIYKDPVLVHRILEFTTEISLGYFQPFLAEGGVHGVFIADPIASGDVISKRHFTEFVLPYLQRVVAGVKQYHAPVMLHICGDVTDRLQMIADSGVDCISLDAKVNLATAKTLVGKRICIAGNVDPVNVLEFGSGASVHQSAVSCLESGAQHGGFILMPGCDFSSRVPVANLKTLVATAHQWQL